MSDESARDLDQAAPEVGQRAPELGVPDSTGRERRLDELVRSRGLVLLFYRGHW